jgi:serine/threonine protein kinase
MACTLLLWHALAKFATHDRPQEALETLLAAGKTRAAGKLVAQVVPKKIAFTSLAFSKDPLFSDIVRKIAPLQNCTELHLGEILEAALFLETEHEHLLLNKTYFLPKQATDLAYDIEYDPETGYRYIHLDTLIGKGKKKRVSKALLLTPTHAEIVACAVSARPMKRELQITKNLQGASGIFKIYGCTQRQENGHTVTAVFSKLYNRGSLRHVFDAQCTFTIEEKLGMATSIIQGIEELHRRHLVHRDLGSRNYLVDISEAPKGSRRVTLDIADLGRTCPIRKVDGSKISGNKSYTCPEGIFRDRMKGSDYFAADIYAIGCVLYQLYYDKNPEWRDAKYVKGSGSADERYRDLVTNIEKYTGERRTLLAQKSEPSLEEKFEYLILTMVDPDPTKRRTAGELRQQFEELQTKALQ